jgi:hypothetical protein
LQLALPSGRFFAALLVFALPFVLTFPLPLLGEKRLVPGFVIRGQRLRA